MGIGLIDYEVAEALALTQLMEIYQQLSGGVRREKRMTIEEFRDFIQDLFTSLTVSGTVYVGGSILQKADTGQINIASGTITNKGGNITLFGSSHPVYPDRQQFRCGAIPVVYLDTNAISLLKDTSITGVATINTTGGNAKALGIVGIGAGTSNAGYIGIYESNGTTLQSYIGINSIGNTDFRINNNVGDVVIAPLGTESARFDSSGRTIFGGGTDNGTDLIQVYGTSANNTGVWATLSDERMKENIKDITSPIQKVIAIARCVKQYNFKEGVNNLEGMRTQFIAQALIEEGFEGHTTELNPTNEIQGGILGWEYGDESYTEEVEKTETMEVLERFIEKDVNGTSIISEKIVEKEIPVTEKKTVENIQPEYITKTVVTKDENGENITTEVKEPTGRYVIVNVEKDFPVMETVTKSRRVVIKEGDKMLQVEQNLTPYLFPAIAEQQLIIESQQAEIESLKADIDLIKKNLGL